MRFFSVNPLTRRGQTDTLPNTRITPPSIPQTFKQRATSFALTLFRMMRMVKRTLQRVVRGSFLALLPVGRFVLKLVVLPFYRLIVTLRIRIQKLALPARGIVLFFVTNRFLFHTTLGIVTLLTVITNLQGRQVHAQDVGQHSVLFALASDQNTETVEEIIRPENQTKDANYLGSGTLVSIPHIDFDYNENADTVAPSIIVPGTIAAQPTEMAPGGPVAPRTRTETYVVQDNDTISTIAQKFGVNVGTVLWNNSLSERQYIRPGDTLTIPPVSGIIATVKKGDTLTKIASQYSGDAAEIASFNGLTADQQLAVGSQLMVPGGMPAAIVETQTRVLTYQPPSSPTPRTTASSVPKPPDANTANVAATHLLWPTSGHVITQYYGWQHTGLDIDGDYSSPLYAAADGVVETAGWNSGGYGLMILIDHPALGMKTRYGHSSKLFVKAGDVVKKGQVIAMMGTTGRSTGTHLHFEVYVGNKRMNPLGYIK